MSRPAARWVHQRTADCPTCGSPRGQACTRVRDQRVGLDTGVWTVSPHAARLRLERELAEALAVAQQAVQEYGRVRKRVAAR